MTDRTQKSIAVIDAAPRYMPLSGFQKYVNHCLNISFWWFHRTYEHSVTSNIIGLKVAINVALIPLVDVILLGAPRKSTEKEENDLTLRLTGVGSLSSMPPTEAL